RGGGGPRCRRARPPVRSFCSPDGAPLGSRALSLHDALPIYQRIRFITARTQPGPVSSSRSGSSNTHRAMNSARNASLTSCCARRSEEHTSELQSRENLVCRLLLEKKKQTVAARSPWEPGGAV